MPPRAKKAAAAAPTTEPNAGDDDAGPAGIGIDQYELPKSVIARLAKGAVPPEVKLQKEVPLALVKGSTVFINYLAALSHDLAAEKNTKTITALHVLEAVKQLGWEDGSGALLEKHLKKELKAFRKINEAKKAGTYVAPTRPPKPVASTKPRAKPTPSTSSDARPAASTSTLAGAADDEEEGRGTTTVLNDERPNAAEGDLYPGDAADDDDMVDEGEEEDGIEVYEVGDDDGDDGLSDPGDDDGVEEPLGAMDKVELDDVDDDED
ncbi:hypothetical protein JCM11491_002903 [Sporobolomyces phaffii]